MSSQESTVGSAAPTGSTGSTAAAASRNVTPAQQQQPPIVNMAPSTYPPSISNLLNHSLRYPICAVQGGSLIYSPMMGQTLFPWRPFTPVATPTTPVSAVAAAPNVSLMSPPTQSTPSRQQQQQTVSLASLMQVPNYSYMTVSSLLGGGTSSSPSEDHAHQQYSVPAGLAIKHEKNDLDESIPNTKRMRIANEDTSSSSNTNGSSVATQSSPASVSRVIHSGGSSATSPTDSVPPYQHQLQYPPSALLRVMNDFYHSQSVNTVILLKCLGLVDPTLLDQYCIKSLSLLQDLFVPPRPGFNSTPPTLPPESYILLTINYLNLLRDGECINLEVIRWVFYNTLLAENQWVNYYRKHKKMTESTFVQLQFSHFTRILTHQSSSDVAVIVSQNSLSEGVILTLQNIMKCSQTSLPKFYVVVAVLQNVPSEMCIVVTDHLHCRWLMELQQSVKSMSAIKESPVQPLHLSREILTSMKRFQTHLLGKVHSPFFNSGKELVSRDEADTHLPPLSSIVEHRPKGPFPDLYNIALVILQKVLHTGHLDRYQKLDFFIICPAYPVLVNQLVQDVQESGLVQLLGIGTHRDEIYEAIGQRIVVCKPSSLELMNSTITGNKHVLYLVISKCSHCMSYTVLNHRTLDSSPVDTCTCDCKSILSHSNTAILYTSAQPYALQTNRAFVTAGNEIHWSQSTVPNRDNRNEMTSGLEFCSLLKHKSSVPVNTWASVREDGIFEEKVLDLCKKEKLTMPISQLRAQVLLTDYASALISMVKKKSSGSLSSHPETLSIVYDLVQRPLGNNKGRGSMVVLRCHSQAIGVNLYNKLKAIVTTLGLQYRFELILDHGDGRLALSTHFQKRLESWGVDKSGDSYSYLDLDHLPCMVIMTGRVRPSIRLPSSLSYVDLRLCHAHLTRTVYDADMSIANGYRNVSSDSAHLSKQPSPSTTKSDKHLSTASSSSMISNEPHVVEWKPTKDVTSEHAHWDKGSPSSYRAQFEYSSTEMDCTDSPAMNGGVAIVEIPQPEDHMTTRYNDSCLVATETDENIFHDLDFDYDCEDSETENDDANSRKITCLLSRQYYHIWQSGDALVDQSLLLPPSDGVVWQASSKWTNLTDHTPSGQSSYYRTWSKPEGKAKRIAMDMLIKENSESRQRCFLLTGPNQVGKTGASLLFIRLLHDYLRSSRGVTALNKLPNILPLIKTTPTSSPMATTYSPVVPINYLTSSDTMATPTSPRVFPLSPSIKQTIVQISAHSIISHDSSHSCPKCSSVSIESHKHSSSLHLSSTIHSQSDPLTVQWHIPSHKVKSVAMTSTNQTLDCVKLPLQTTPSNIPIFSISPDLKDSALLNLSHTAENNLHVVVTKLYNFNSYKTTWPNHIIAALPDSVFLGVGSCINAILTLIDWNYSQNMTRLTKDHVNASGLTPWALILNDAVCMVLKEGGDCISIDLGSLLRELVAEDSEADLISIRPWCEPRPSQSHDFVLDSNFLLLNIAELSEISYNPLNFKSSDLDYHLRLLSHGYTIHIPSQYIFVKKHIKADGPASLVDLSPHLSSHPDRLVTSLHHDTSSLLSYPGPLLLETFLLHKSHTLFSSAHSPNNPVLMMEHYINLGPKVHVSLLTCRQLEDAIGKVIFGGLVLYLCEGLVSSQMLQRLKFVKGACLLLITRDCKGLVREVSRLDIEEYWHFKLRDEFQTACGDQNQPLFFLTGKYLSINVT